MLSVLKESAASCASYVRMVDLEPGKYHIHKFSLRDSKFGKRVVIEIDQGYMYLPEKMYKKFNTEKAIAKLNKEDYDFVYEGKKVFTFEKHTMSDNENDDDDDERSDDDNDTNNRNHRNHRAGSSGVAPKRPKKK